MDSVFFIRLLQFILSISLLVLLHEGGHYIFSKIFGVRVEKFYIFFDVGIGKWTGSLFKWKPKKSDTEYGIGWLPLGGYCKISGMIDESMDTEQMKKPPQPWEFRTKPAWQRLLIMIGGVLVNFLLALFIYSMVLFYWGESYIETKNMTNGMKFNTEAKKLGFKDGDILLGTDTKTFKLFDADLYRGLSEAKRADIIRDGKKMSVTLPGDLNLLEMIKNDPPFVSPLVPTEIDSVLADTPASKLGLAKGDVIMAVNGKDVDSWNEFTYEIGKLNDVVTAKATKEDSIKGRTVTIAVKHKATGAVDTLKTMLDTDMKLGVVQSSIWSIYEPTKTEYGFFESFPAGARYGVNILKGYVDDLKYVFTADGAKSLGGFGAIGSLFPPTWDWMMFWRMTAFLSIILAFMNILPIPALDGGHVLFLLYEIITRRKPSEKFLVIAEYAGITILILLMVVANLNDILRWIGVM